MLCVCGNDRFYAHQIIRADVIVDSDGAFLENATERLEESIYDAERPYGPFTCTKCGKEYDELRQ